jgi:hypothetical protein
LPFRFSLAIVAALGATRATHPSMTLPCMVLSRQGDSSLPTSFLPTMGYAWNMIRKSGYRFSEEIMLKQEDKIVK